MGARSHQAPHAWTPTSVGAPMLAYTLASAFGASALHRLWSIQFFSAYALPALAAGVVGAASAARALRRKTGVPAHELGGPTAVCLASCWPIVPLGPLATAPGLALLHAFGGGVVYFYAGLALTMLGGAAAPLAATHLLVRRGLFIRLARRTARRLRARLGDDAPCFECGLRTAEQRTAGPDLGVAGWLVPLASVLGMLVLLALGVVLTLPPTMGGQAGPNRVTIWWSPRAVALLALPAYTLLVLAWVVPSVSLASARRAAGRGRLAMGRCARCGQSLSGPGGDAPVTPAGAPG